MGRSRKYDYDAMCAKVLDLVDRGLSFRKIAREIEVSVSTAYRIYRYCKECIDITEVYLNFERIYNDMWAFWLVIFWLRGVIVNLRSYGIKIDDEAFKLVKRMEELVINISRYAYGMRNWMLLKLRKELVKRLVHSVLTCAVLDDNMVERLKNYAEDMMFMVYELSELTKRFEAVVGDLDENHVFRSMLWIMEHFIDVDLEKIKQVLRTLIKPETDQQKNILEEVS